MESLVSPLLSISICFIVLYLPDQNLIQALQLKVKHAFIDSIVCNYQIQQTSLGDEYASKDSGLIYWHTWKSLIRKLLKSWPI